MDKKGFVWLLVRCAIIILFALGGVDTFNNQNAAPNAYPFWAFLFHYFGALLLVPMLMRRTLKRDLRKGKTRDWSRSSWTKSPFSSPLNFMNMGSYAFTLMALIGLMKDATQGQFHALNLFPLAFGWGIYSGLTLFTKTLDKTQNSAQK